MAEPRIPLWKVARGLGWSTMRTLRQFRRAGYCHRDFTRSEWWVSRVRLMAIMPTVVARIDELEAAGMLGSHRGGCRFGSGRKRIKEIKHERQSA